MHRLKRPHPGGAGSTCLDLAEHEFPPVEGDDVELPPASPVVALEDAKASPDQVLRGQGFANLTKLLAPFGHTQPRYGRSRDTWVTVRFNTAHPVLPGVR